MNKLYLMLFAILFLSFSACRKDDLSNDSDDSIIDMSDYPDWNEATHGINANLDYSTVFNQEEVLRFDIEISADDWEAMESDLAANLGFKMGGGGRGPGDITMSDFQPIWVPCSFKFNGTEWYHVGIRYKGNSSLQSAYRAGISKLSFKLDFDEFEEDYPAITDQRFYGFHQLNLKNNYDDPSLMREKVGADLFREFGLASSQTAFCEVYVDFGEGPQYFGLYTLVEEVDDTVYKTQFGQSSGNLYKPDGNAASFSSGSYNTDQFYLKTNEYAADYSDVKALYDAINSTLRVSEPETWKTELESAFNVDVFLKWLAANTAIQNWDTYGNMTHNYYLYHNPEDNTLHWIPWDNNEAFQYGKNKGALSLSMSEVNNDWPLISYIIAQPEYEEVYKEYLQQFIEKVFVPSDMISMYSSYYDLLKEYAYAEESGYTFIRSNSQFDYAVETLKSHVQSRNDAVVSYLQ